MLTFWRSGAYPIALVIFTASILIPLLKIAGAELALRGGHRQGPSVAARRSGKSIGSPSCWAAGR
jgi:uncharacterized paraquat-inducible protein A